LKHPGPGNPGGVVLAILGPWAEHVTKVQSDDLGRWVSATLTGSNGDSCTIFSLYNVVDTSLKDAGPSTVYAQQYRLLRLAGVTYPAPRQQCIEDLKLVIGRLQANREAIIITGDFNETLGTNPRLMASVCAEHHMFDVQAHFHGDSADIATYIRGTKRLDYCLASPELEKYIVASGYNLFNEHIFSDHRASFMDIHLKYFFGHELPRLTRPDLRFMSTNSPDVSKFIHKMHSHLTENKAFHQFHEFCIDLDAVDEPWHLANKLDQLVGQPGIPLCRNTLFQDAPATLVS
jgi:hypothetical protein